MRWSNLACSVLMTAGLFAVIGVAQADYAGGSQITTLMGYKPGGGSDQLAQLTEPYLSKSLNAKMVNEYMPGAAGAIAWTRLAKQAPGDGSTLSIITTPTVVTNYIMNDAITYNISELALLANIITDPGVLVVNTHSPYKSFKQLVTAAKKHPGDITVSNSGVGGDDFFSTILIGQATDVEFKRVPFQGDGPSYTAALSGKVDASSNNLSIVYSQIKADKLRPLAVYSNHRLKQLPDVPTLKELGVDVVSGSSRGFAGPADMPKEARQQFIAAVEKMQKNPEFQKQAEAQGLNIDIKTGKQYRAMLENMSTQYTQVWKSVEEQVRK